jgi:hypothetical protein
MQQLNGLRQNGAQIDSVSSNTVSRENAFNPLMSSHGRSGGALIKPQHRNLISNKNHNCNVSLAHMLP